MQKSGLTSPLLVKYLEAYEKNPKSRVFAPLAETYRKLGMREKAFEILKQGIKNHPSYLMGYLGLAFCYKDLGKLELAYSTIRPFVDGSRDNIRLQKLFGSICFELNYFEEALDTYKFLLFLNPRDRTISKIVKKIEESFNNSFVKNELTINEIPTNEISLFGDNESEKSRWIQKDLTKPNKTFNESYEKEIKDEKSSFDFIERVGKEPNINGESVEKPDKMANKFKQISKKKEVNKGEGEERKEGESIVTLTLVDLYLSQGYKDKAIDVLEKLISLNPDDKTLRNKRQELDGGFGRGPALEETESFEKRRDDKEFLMVKNRMNSFLNEIKKRAESFKEA